MKALYKCNTLIYRLNLIAFQVSMLTYIFTEHWHHIQEIFKCEFTILWWWKHFANSVFKRIHLNRNRHQFKSNDLNIHHAYYIPEYELQVHTCIVYHATSTCTVLYRLVHSVCHVTETCTVLLVCTTYKVINNIDLRKKQYYF